MYEKKLVLSLEPKLNVTSTIVEKHRSVLSVALASNAY